MGCGEWDKSNLVLRTRPPLVGPDPLGLSVWLSQGWHWPGGPDPPAALNVSLFLSSSREESGVWAEGLCQPSKLLLMEIH